MYEIHPVTLDKDHPNWPNLQCWKIYDTVRKQYGLVLYLSEERAVLAAHDLHTRNNLSEIKRICEDNNPEHWIPIKELINE